MEAMATQSRLELSAKVFRNELFKNVLIGGTTTFRHLDLLRYSEDLFDEVDFYKKSEIDHKFMVTKFIPKVVKLFKQGIISSPEQSEAATSSWPRLEGIFEIQSDYSSPGARTRHLLCGMRRRGGYGESADNDADGHEARRQNRHGSESGRAVLLWCSETVPHLMHGWKRRNHHQIGGEA